MAHLKLDTQKGFIEADGKATEIAALLMIVINQIYSSLARSNRGTAMIFQAAVRAGVLSPDLPLWEIDTEHESTSIVMPLSKKGGAKNGTTDI